MLGRSGPVLKGEELGLPGKKLYHRIETANSVQQKPLTNYYCPMILITMVPTTCVCVFTTYPAASEPFVACASQAT